MRDLSKKAQSVAELFRRQREAGRSAEQATVEVMRAIVEAARPALPALSSAIQLGERRPERGEPERTYAGPHVPRGVLLVDSFVEGPGELTGELRGSRLYLLEDGRFALLERSGCWYTVVEKPDKWTLTSTIEESIVTESEAAGVCAPAELASLLESKIEAQLGGRGSNRAYEIERLAARLSAVAVLLRT